MRCRRWWSKRAFPSACSAPGRIWRPASPVLAYPAPRAAGAAAAAGAKCARRDPARTPRPGQRARRRARLAPRRQPAPGGVEEGGAQRRNWCSRETTSESSRELWLDWQAAAVPERADAEARLSRLAPGCWRPSSRGWSTACGCPACRSRPTAATAHAAPAAARAGAVALSPALAHTAALAGLAPPAARQPRHAVPAGGDRLDDAAAPGAPGAVVRRADRR